MRSTLKYLKYLLIHKWYVFVYGLKYGVNPIQLILHDYTKFYMSELIPYRNWFTRQIRTKESSEAFHAAWLHHIHNNKHHWEHWVLRTTDDKMFVLRMPEKYVREMAADWSAMGAYFGNTAAEWYTKNKHGIALHPQTRSRVEVLIGYKNSIENVEVVNIPIHRKLGS